ncbi:hypothetical protein [Altererythrobacter sp. ZODW24]|uniref:hypothetical protein n=1 Tax=Altererythrobacter sp. ZODW24 TaxID=2185142 RepID=UPI000DF732F2|nr:hypothetical protein [Altererythrobacter sp. ZODW24]
MRKILALLLSLVALSWSPAAMADVTVSFHSFNGSMFFGRYPHTFVVFEGQLDDGTPVNQNFGFTAKTAGPAVLAGPVRHEIVIEKPKEIRKTNRHFSIKISDAKYRAMVAEMRRWRDAPGKYYSLDSRNCIHFVGKMGEMAGLKITYPKKMIRKPKKWLNYISELNPRLSAKRVK